MLRYLVVLCLALVLPLHCGAATDGSTPTEEHHHHAAPSAAEAAGVGVAERLGEKIPLDLTYNDEAGRPASSLYVRSRGIFSPNRSATPTPAASAADGAAW